MYFSVIEFATPAFDEILYLRDLILRKPLGMVFHAEDIATEWNQVHLAAYDDMDELLASLILKPLDDNTMKMRQVAVFDHLQGKGIGKTIVKESEAYCRANNYEKIELSARSIAVPFYEKLKYTKVGSMYQEVGIDHFKMEKYLNE